MPEVIEFGLAAVAASCAGFFTNPLDVVKTRMQLQGELKARGKYQVHYRNLFHATYVIIKTDGIRGIQSGLAPALAYQFIMNGVRLGSYQTFINMGFTSKSGNGDSENSDISYFRTVLCGALAGGMGAVVGSPAYMIKNQLQVKSNHSIAVGHQFEHNTMREALSNIYKQNGLKGLWRGVDGAVVRVMIGSGVQLSTFSNIRALIINNEIFKPNSIFIPITASIIGAGVVVTCMTPFDLISTRLYNQPTDKHGKGLRYKNLFDCMRKIFKPNSIFVPITASFISGFVLVTLGTPLDLVSTRLYNQPIDKHGNGLQYKNLSDCVRSVFRQEGFRGFYKGYTASCFRIAPHTMVCLCVWDQTRYFYLKYLAKETS